MFKYASNSDPPTTFNDMFTSLNNSYTVDQLEPRIYYNPIIQSSQIGFLADNVRSVYPGLVITDTVTSQAAINYNGIITLLVNDLQYKKKTITSMKSQIYVLEQFALNM